MSDTTLPREGAALTLLDKIWARHRIIARDDGQDLLFIDRHYVHDVTASAFQMLRNRGLRPRSPERVFGTADHYVPTHSRDFAAVNHPERRAMIQALTRDTREAGIDMFGLDDPRQGIVHIIGPEQGLSLPGMTIACADSHTSTHGALGALAFGIGVTEVGHVLATQSLWQRKPKRMRIRVEGRSVRRWRPRTSSWPSSPGSASRAPPATWSNTPAPPSPDFRWKAG